jgi:hypothetical protein
VSRSRGPRSTRVVKAKEIAHVDGNDAALSEIASPRFSKIRSGQRMNPGSQAEGQDPVCTEGVTSTPSSQLRSKAPDSPVTAFIPPEWVGCGMWAAYPSAPACAFATTT